MVVKFEEREIRRVDDEKTETWPPTETRNKLTDDYWADHDIRKGEEFAILTNVISTPGVVFIRNGPMSRFRNTRPSKVIGRKNAASFRRDSGQGRVAGGA